MNPRRASRPNPDYQDSSDEDIECDKFEKDRQASRAAKMNYTYQDVKTLLQDACPDELNAVLDHGIVPFMSIGARQHSSFATTGDKRLQFGRIESPIPEYREPVFIYLGGEGNNRIALASGADTTNFELSQAHLVAPHPPFWYLTSHGRVIDGAENKRVRALTCFLFLQAGHVQTVQYYPDIEEDLKDAIVWYGAGLEVYVRETSNRANPTTQRDSTDGIASHASEQSPEARLFEPVIMLRRPGSVVHEQQSCKFTDQPLNKKRKTSIQTYTSANKTDMRRHYEQLGNDIAKYERESAALEHQQKITEELKQKVSQSAQECDSLRKQLEAEGTKIETLETKAERLNKCNKVLCDKLSTARNYAQRSKEEVEKERLRHEDEEEKRIAAEKRLEEFLDAQKKMNELIMGFRK